MKSDRWLAGALRWVVVWAYAMVGWQMCHDGTSAGELAGMFVVGGICLVFVVAIGWILDGPGQLDREVGDDEP